jgi:hypothetical protein
MDRITFESVMEEIKKSLGEARLMKIGEESVADTQAEIQKGIDARNATRDAIKMKSVDDADVARDAKEKTIPAPAPAPVPKSANEPSMTNSVMNAPAAAPAPSSAPATPKLPSMAANGPSLGSSNYQGSNTPEKPSAPAPTPVKNIGMAAKGDSSSYGTSPLNNKPTTPSAPSTGAGTVAKPAAPKPSAPKPSAPAGVDTASIYKKHGVGGSDEDAGAFHRAEAEIAAARKATPSAPAARPSTPSASRPSTPSAPSAPRPVSQGTAAPRPTSSPLSSLSTSGQAIAKQHSGKVGTDSSGNNPMPAPAPKAAASTPSTGGVTNTPYTGAIKGDNATQGTSPKGFGSSMTRIPYDPKNPAPSTTTRTPYDPKSPSKSIVRPAATTMKENFDQFVKKFLKESK